MVSGISIVMDQSNNNIIFYHVHGPLQSLLPLNDTESQIPMLYRSVLLCDNRQMLLLGGRSNLWHLFRRMQLPCDCHATAVHKCSFGSKPKSRRPGKSGVSRLSYQVELAVVILCSLCIENARSLTLRTSYLTYIPYPP